MNEKRIDLCVYRMLNASDTLDAARLCMGSKLCKDAINCCYYAASHAIILKLYSAILEKSRVAVLYVVTDQKGFMQDNKNYLFVKCFTAKEESRRLQCGVYLAKDFPQYRKISVQNQINSPDGVLAKR